VTTVVRREARETFVGALGSNDRVLVTGAGGWFGSTIAALLAGSGHPTMFLTQRPRLVRFGEDSADAVAWNIDDVRDFAPTVVFDCAFILRDYIEAASLEHYVHENTVLTGRLLQLVGLESVHTVVSVSSGASMHPVDASSTEVAANPYGYLKRQAELAVLRFAEERGTSVVIARPYSLSGSLVSRPERYAFSNLILQARAGHVRIESAHEVWRRYVGVDDFFAVALAAAGSNALVLDSGGELLEFSALAARIVTELDLQVETDRPALSGAAADDYHSTDVSWIAACESIGFRPADLGEQIRSVDAYLASASNA
jgi:nucleoside-diphosphate-sugar epimerase